MTICKEFKMTQKQLAKILDACKPVPAIMLQCGMPRSPQQNANDAWEALGKELGFESMTVRPVPGKGQEYFIAEVI